MVAPAPPAAPVGHALAFDAIGTRWRIDAPVPLDAVADEIAATVDRYDRAWSRFRDDSLVARMAREGGSHALPPEGPALLGLLRRLHDATGGAVTPLVGAAMEHHGYDAAYSLVPRAGRRACPRGTRPSRTPAGASSCAGRPCSTWARPGRGSSSTW